MNQPAAPASSGNQQAGGSEQGTIVATALNLLLPRDTDTG